MAQFRFSESSAFSDTAKVGRNNRIAVIPPRQNDANSVTKDVTNIVLTKYGGTGMMGGPTLVGPILVGPTLVGPTLVGPTLVGPTHALDLHNNLDPQ